MGKVNFNLLITVAAVTRAIGCISTDASEPIRKSTSDLLSIVKVKNVVS